MIAAGLDFAQSCVRLQEREQQRLSCGARADDPRRDAVNAGVEKSMPTWTRSRNSPRTSSSISARVASSRMTTWSAVQRTPRLTCSNRRGTNCRIEETLSEMLSVGVEVTGVEAVDFFARDGVAEIELVRAHDVRFRGEAE